MKLWNKNKMNVILDSRLKFNYASWYLQGIYEVFGRKTVNFDVEPFRALKYENNKDLNAGMAVILKEDGKVCKVFIDFEDVAKIFEDRYEWCDVYAMVNPKKEQLEQYPKAMAIGPETILFPINSICGIISIPISVDVGCRVLREESVFARITYSMPLRYGIMNLHGPIQTCIVGSS